MTSLSLSCPSCQTEYDPALGSFCENCGYDLNTNTPLTSSLGSQKVDLTHSAVSELSQETGGINALCDVPTHSPHPDTHAPEAELRLNPTPSAHPSSLPTAWELEITIDPSLWEPESSPAPPEHPTYTYQLCQPQTLIGRKTLTGHTHEHQAAYPDLSLDHDSAISRLHALLLFQRDGRLLLRDLVSSNGTFIKEAPLLPMEDIQLSSGDSFTLGHWTRITVHAR